MTKLKKGYVHVYTGDGKGKTTAALGLVFRAAGHGLKSLVIQFMKGQIKYGELESAKKLGDLVTIKQMGRASFVDKDNPDPEDIRLAQEALILTRETLTNGQHDIVVLDEINVALDFHLISLEDVLELCRLKPENVELVLTGRHVAQEVIAVADLVTEMCEVKHYYDRNVKGRRGIEH